MAGIFYTGASVNTARSFGPAVVNGSFPKEHWIYWFAPTLGAILAATFYKILKAVSYETINPGQDFDDIEAGAIEGELRPRKQLAVATMQNGSSTDRPLPVDSTKPLPPEPHPAHGTQTGSKES
ncbi:MAG: hypothetical protein Q9160_005742 [Pyrenula sp. 1 TL-2023]